ncbi:helix-turn-helix domain-containing protein [Rhodococcus pyridinivorans]|uniref:helix-turn-helix domain-containing protein n=1 Tax=Rhodococcus pyridinivorans TaxID=103816 RepID=UPI0021649321|nr:helix-turn-helix domain-containing protein [Rhodococcus pyridinivorans]UVT26256.1 helix-turn-helix domain-containing protein [Rhodococcus pyridinivorans]
MGQNTLAGGVRRGPRLASNFTILSNAVINDERLSFRARGVLIWLLSKPDDWRTRSDAIAGQSPKEGRDAIRSALRELAELGYLIREKIQNERGQWITIQTIYEEPCTGPEPEKPTRGRADNGEPGGLSSIDLPRTKTNRMHQASTSTQSPEVARLAAACKKSGLSATFAYLRPVAIAAMEALIATHGVPTLVAAAKAAHRPGDPMRYAHAWLPMWQRLPVPRVRPAKCDECDEYGWLPDDEHGRAVRCHCRTPQAA